MYVLYRGNAKCKIEISMLYGYVISRLLDRAYSNGTRNYVVTEIQAPINGR